MSKLVVELEDVAQELNIEITVLREVILSSAHVKNEDTQ